MVIFKYLHVWKLVKMVLKEGNACYKSEITNFAYIYLHYTISFELAPFINLNINFQIIIA